MATFKAVSEERYFEMLEVLPPAVMDGKGFLVGEAVDHRSETGWPRFEAFIEYNGKYYQATEPMTAKEYRTLRILPEELKD